MTLPSLLEVDQPDPREATLRQIDWLWQNRNACTPDHDARHSYASMPIASGAEPRADGRGQISSGGLA